MSNRESVSHLLIALQISLVGLAFGGWVLAQLWGWFVVPLGVGPVTWAQAVGLHLVALLLVGFRDDRGSDADVPLILRAVLRGLLAPACVWGLGYLAHLCY